MLTLDEELSVHNKKLKKYFNNQKKKNGIKSNDVQAKYYLVN